MESITLQPSEKQIQDFVAQYQEQLVSSKNPYIRYLFKLDKATASIYTSGKVLFQGEKAEQAAQFLAIRLPEKKRQLLSKIVLLSGQMKSEMALISAGLLLWHLLSHQNSIGFYESWELMTLKA